ncbi:hypothetical protein WJX73_009107 [Symbiochloris irregularis]|uniref:C3H1-type domain-containing protein n=1 Tax=Symbiochloris irregularis TaxID=706552 RepID=A0AAW1PL69_9CHLO
MPKALRNSRNDRREKEGEVCFSLKATASDSGAGNHDLCIGGSMARKKRTGAAPSNASTDQQREAPAPAAKSATSSEQIASLCGRALIKYQQADRGEAIQFLQSLAKAHPEEYLPHRYLGRVLFHEAALSGHDQRAAHQHIGLSCLKDALLHTITATELAPNSLSCAALRATLLLNMILEHCISADGQGPASPALSSIAYLSDQLAAALKHCRTVAEHPGVQEVDVRIYVGGLRTNDPCCLGTTRDQAALLAALIEVMHKCSKVLSDVQNPAAVAPGLLRLILSPGPEELQLWSQQLVGSPWLGQAPVDDSQAPSMDLMRLMQPQGPDLFPSNLSLSRQRTWEHNRELSMARRIRGRGKGDRRAEMTPEECFLDVKDFWLRLSPEQRSALLRVPICQLIISVRKEQGDMAAADVTYGLQRLRENRNMRACFWACCYCPNAAPRFDAVKQYQRHLERCHECVQLDDDGRPLPCGLCQRGVVGAWYCSHRDPSRRLCLRCFWQQETLRRISAQDFMRMEPDAAGSTHSSPAADQTSPAAATSPRDASLANGFGSDGSKVSEHGGASPRQAVPGSPARLTNGSSTGQSDAPAPVSASASPVSAKPAASSTGIWHSLSAPFTQWKAAASAKLSDMLAQPRYPPRQPATSGSQSSSASSSVSALSKGAQAQGLADTYQTIQHHWEALRLTLQREGLAGGAGPLTKDILTRLPSRTFEDTKAINPILEYIKRGLVRDRDAFQVHLQAILDRVSQQPVAGPPLGAANGASVITTNAELEMRLKQLSPTDLQLLLFYMFSFDPSAVLPLLPTGVHPDGMAGITREMLAANEAVEKLQLSRDTGDAHSKAVGPFLHVQQWWLLHLLGRGESEGWSAEESGNLAVLQWVYGNVTNTHAEEYQQRRRDLQGGQSHEAALATLYHDLAGAWFRLWDVTDKKGRLTNLRQIWMDNNREVKELEDTGMDRMRAAMDFVQQLPATASILPSRVASESTMQQLQALSISQASVLRYSLVLVQRESAKNDLMLVAYDIEGAEAAAEAASGDRRMSELRQQVWDAECELNKAQAEGPANHRKRDFLDKATKEAEHRDKLEELRVRIADLKAKHAAADESQRTHKEQQDTCRRELQNLQTQMRMVKAMLDEIKRINSADSPMPSMRDHQWQQRLGARLQQLRCVAQAIGKFGGRQAAGAAEAEQVPLLHAMSVTRKHLDGLEVEITRIQEDITRLRVKLQDMTCVDMAVEISERALDVVRAQIEAAAAAAKEAASHSLLRELEEEAAQHTSAKKAAEGKKGKKAKAKAKDAKKGSKTASGAGLSGSRAEDAQATSQAEDSERQAQQEDMEYEAALERRRLEVEEEHLRRDLEQLRLVSALSRMDSHATAEDAPGGSESVPPEDEGYATDRSEGSTLQPRDSESIQQLPQDSVDDLQFDEATRAAVEASLRDLAESSAKADETSQAESEQTQPKRRNRKQRFKANQEKEKVAQEQAPTMRIVSHFGDWQCSCGLTSRLWDACSCGRVGPCRDWVRGRCKYQEACRFEHPPFDLRGPAPSSPVACPSPEATLWVDNVLVQQAGQHPDGRPVASVPSSSDLETQSLTSTDVTITLPSTPRRPSTTSQQPSARQRGPAWQGRAPAQPNTRSHGQAPASSRSPGHSSEAAASAPAPGMQRTKSLPQLDRDSIAGPAPGAPGGTASASATPGRSAIPLSSFAGSEASFIPPLAALRASEDVPATDAEVKAPPRAAPMAAVPQDLQGWSPMGNWGAPLQTPSQPAPAPAPAPTGGFNPFGDNPLLRALASTYKRPAETEAGISAALPTGLFDEAQPSSGLHSGSAPFSSAEASRPSDAALPSFFPPGSMGSDVLRGLPTSSVTSSTAPSLSASGPFALASAQGGGWPSLTGFTTSWFLSSSMQGPSRPEDMLPQSLGFQHANGFSASLANGSVSMGEGARRHAYPEAPRPLATAFLDSLLQALWHVWAFRKSLLSIQETQYAMRPETQVLVAMKRVFAAMNALAQSGGNLGAAPGSLSSAQEHQAGEELSLARSRFMAATSSVPWVKAGDAAEALEAFMTCLDTALQGGPQPPGNPLPLLQQLCGLSMDEVARCEQCGRVLHRMQYTKFTQLATAATLRSMAQAVGARRPLLEHLLRREVTGPLRFCDPQQGGCGLRTAMQARLRSIPSLYAICLAWPSAQASPQDVGAVLSFVQPSIDLGLIYPGLGTRHYRLSCMICVHGAHHMTLAKNTSGAWQLHNDYQMQPLGSWQAVATHCHRGCLQPSLLLYEVA